MQDCDATIAADPKWAKGYLRKGKLLLKLMQFADAIVAFTGALVRCSRPRGYTMDSAASGFATSGGGGMVFGFGQEFATAPYHWDSQCCVKSSVRCQSSWSGCCNGPLPLGFIMLCDVISAVTGVHGQEFATAPCHWVTRLLRLNSACVASSVWWQSSWLLLLQLNPADVCSQSMPRRRPLP
jgi:hypothetical protein